MPYSKKDFDCPKGMYVEVTFDVDSGITISADAQAVIVSPSVVTDRRLDSGKRPSDDFGQCNSVKLDKKPVKLDQVIKTVQSLADSFSSKIEGANTISYLINITDANLSGNGAKIKDTTEGEAWRYYSWSGYKNRS